MIRPEGALLNVEDAPIERFGVGGILFPGEPGKVEERQGDVRVIRPERLLPDREGAPVERFGRRVIVLVVVNDGEEVKGVGHVRMVRPEDFLPDGEGTLRRRQRLVVLPLFPQLRASANSRRACSRLRSSAVGARRATMFTSYRPGAALLLPLRTSS